MSGSEPGSIPESRVVLGETSTKKANPVSYIAVHQGELISGLLLLLVGIPAIFIDPGGLFYFILPLPTFVWTSIGPLIVGSVFVLRSLLLIERVTIAGDGTILQIKTKRLIPHRETIPMQDVRYIDIRHLESKVFRWLGAFGLFLVSYEIHFKNGIDLLGHAGVAPFLLLCFVVVCIALAIFIVTPRQVLEIGIDRKAYFIPLPGITQHRDAMAAIARLVGFHDKTMAMRHNGKVARAIISHELFAVVTGVMFIVIGATLMSNGSWFFGDVIVPALVMLGVKWLHDALLGNRRLVKMEDEGEYRRDAGTFVAKRVLGGIAFHKDVINARIIHPLEMLVIFYLIAQAVKHGFRFVFWPYLGFDAGYFVLGVLLLAVLFFKWFGIIEQQVVDFGTFSMQFTDVNVTEAREIAKLSQRVKNYIIDRARRVGKAFLIAWHDKRQFWFLIAFALFLLVPVLYYSLSYPPFIF